MKEQAVSEEELQSAKAILYWRLESSGPLYIRRFHGLPAVLDRLATSRVLDNSFRLIGPAVTRLASLKGRTGCETKISHVADFWEQLPEQG
jgi:hypothetical protein